MPGESLVSHLDAFHADLMDRVEEMRRHDRFIDLHCGAERSAAPTAAEMRL
jgi:hypothetical protein